MVLDDIVDRKHESLEERIKEYIIDVFEANYLEVYINGNRYVEDDYTVKQIEGDTLYFNHPAPGADAEWDLNELTEELIKNLKEDHKKWDLLSEEEKIEYVTSLFVYNSKKD